MTTGFCSSEEGGGFTFGTVVAVVIWGVTNVGTDGGTAADGFGCCTTTTPACLSSGNETVGAGAGANGGVVL